VIGMGSDSRGSIRNPSALNSLVGLRPTLGLIPAGFYPKRGEFGPMARTVSDLATFLDVVAGPHVSDPESLAAAGQIPDSYTDWLLPHAASGCRIGVNQQILSPASDDVRAVFDQTVADRADLGAQILDVGPVPQTSSAGNYYTGDSFNTSMPAICGGKKAVLRKPGFWRFQPRSGNVILSVWN
jgi:Asp-tRNA(Asn)/Glu-tRNA(Gln) amidotransferase A subunit family amidase